MLMESRSIIEQRQDAAQKWLAIYVENNPSGPEGSALRLIAEIILTHRTSDYLAEFDPEVLKQAQLMLDGTCWEIHMHPRKK